MGVLTGPAEILLFKMVNISDMKTTFYYKTMDHIINGIKNEPDFCKDFCSVCLTNGRADVEW